MKKIIIAALFVFAAFTNTASAKDLKIGFVGVERLLTESPQVEAVNTAMLERFGGKKEELKKLDAELKALQENYKRNELVMTEDKLKELQTQYIAKMQAFKQKEALLGKEVNAMRSQELAVLQKSIRDIINQVAKKENYDLILSEGVLFAADALDITESILGEMKKNFKK